MKRSASSAAREPVATSGSRPVEQRLEVDVPDPRDVAAVGDLVVQRDDARAAARSPSTSVRTASFAPAGFLISSISSARSPTAIRSKRPNAAAKPLEPAPRSRRATRPSASRERRRGDRVVDVVEPRQPQARRARVPSGVASVKATPVEPAQLDLARRDVERRPRVAAGRAAVVAEMADVGRRVRRTACRTATQYFESAACWSDGRAWRGSSTPKTTQPAASARELAELRIVGVDDEQRASGERRDRLAPALGDELELAVAVELVAEEVAEADRPRPRRAARPRAAPPRRPRTARARRRARRASVEATPETRFAPDALCASRTRGARISRRHRGGRRLAVRRRDERRALRQPRGEPVDRAGIELPEQLAGQRRAAAAPREPREAAAARARGSRLERRAGRARRPRYRADPGVTRSRELSRGAHPGGGCSGALAKPRFRPDFAAGDQGLAALRHHGTAARAKARKGDTQGEERRKSQRRRDRAPSGARATVAESLDPALSGARAAGERSPRLSAMLVLSVPLAASAPKHGRLAARATTQADLDLARPGEGCEAASEQVRAA